MRRRVGGLSPSAEPSSRREDAAPSEARIAAEWCGVCAGIRWSGCLVALLGDRDYDSLGSVAHSELPQNGGDV